MRKKEKKSVFDLELLFWGGFFVCVWEVFVLLSGVCVWGGFVVVFLNSGNDAV